ncbi:MAG: glutaredoxin domain-containing protein [bacterium]
MAEIKMYTVDYCPYCKKAKKYFDEKGIKYTDIDLTEERNMREIVSEATNGVGRTVPQIFINGKLIGGWSDLEKLDKAGKVEELLK